MKRQMFSLFIFYVCICMGFMLASCSTEQAEPQLTANQDTDARTKDIGRDTSPFCLVAPQSRSRLDESANTALAGITNLSLDVLRANREAGSSIMFSPLSLGYAMGMVGLACDGVTLQELNSVVGLPPADRTTLPDLCATLMKALPEADANVSLNLANAFYLNAARTDVKVNAAYQSALLAAYDADCETLDFTTPEALAHINTWCSRQTNGFIPKVVEMLNEGAISYLLNALYFKAKWSAPFVTDFTRDEPFHLEDGTTKRLKMMHQESVTRMPYAATDTYQAVALPYAMGKYSMTVVLPKEGVSVGDLLDGLTAQKIGALSASMDYKDVYVSMPKFETTVTTQLVETLKSLGLPSWFSQSCLIRGMVEDLDGTAHGVFVSEMFQVARIRVNEEGTEAAAVTVVEITDGAGPAETIFLNIDHPFVYYISEKDTGAVLFVGTFEGDEGGGTVGVPTGIRDVRM